VPTLWIRLAVSTCNIHHGIQVKNVGVVMNQRMERGEERIIGMCITLAKLESQILKEKEICARELILPGQKLFLDLIIIVVC